MATHVHETYSCDRCGAPLKEKHPDWSFPHITMRFSSQQQWYGKTTVWDDLCEACHTILQKFVADGGK